MQGDQAAGLRRMRHAQSPTCISIFFTEPAAVLLLMQALNGQGKAPLLVDTIGRQGVSAGTRSLFDWRRQVEKMQLLIVPLAHGDGFSAEGAAAGEPAIVGAAGAYDVVLFDAGPVGAAVNLAYGVSQHLLLQVGDDARSLEGGYSLLKSRPLVGHTGEVLLSGSPSACQRLIAAARHFLGEQTASRIWTAGSDDPHFVALAARIAAEEAGRQARGEHGVPARHG